MFASAVRSSVRRSLLRAFLSRANAPLVRPRVGARYFWTGAAFAVGAGIHFSVGGDDHLQLDSSSPENALGDVAVDSSISPFPLNISGALQSNLHADYQLLGHGVRTVTFLSFKVYGIGLYIACADVDRARQVLKNETDIAEALKDPVASQQVIASLLDSGVRFMVRICPVRNTDFGHLKDGITKSILAHALSKQNRDITATGLEQLRAVFLKKRGSVPKNHLLYIEIIENGLLSMTYENPVTREIFEMGTVCEPQISKTLFLLYMSGAKPLSGPLRDSCVQGFLGL